jgi:hypothetical protein
MLVRYSEQFAKVYLTGLESHGEKAITNSKRETIYDDVLAKFDITWGSNNLLYHMLNS